MIMGAGPRFATQTPRTFFEDLLAPDPKLAPRWVSTVNISRGIDQVQVALVN